MADLGETIEQDWTRRAAQDPGHPLPGLLLLFSGTRPLLLPVPLGERPIEIGRGQVVGIPLEDSCLSRRHVEVTREGETWVVSDLASRNGSALDGRSFQGVQRVSHDALLRAGDTLGLLCSDLRPYLGGRVTTEGEVTLGPTLRRVWDDIDDAAAGGETLHLTGETGTGKELAARRFHQAGPRAEGPFVAVNCANIPAALAERLLFGARKGAYSGADADVEGHLQAAHQGTLFLDEVAELELQVQAKLLRVLETREVLPLGGTRPRKLAVGVVSATHGDLGHHVAEGRFRQDLHYRLGRPRVTLPPLRQRREDLAFLIERGLTHTGAGAPHASLVEAALLRPWPGNVRELLLELQQAVRAAQRAGGPQVRAEHLAPEAGRPTGASPATPDAREAAPAPARPAAPTPARPQRERPATAPTRAIPEAEALTAALRRHGGNISAAARDLGAHRTQLKRWMAFHKIDATAGAGDEPDEDR